MTCFIVCFPLEAMQRVDIRGDQLTCSAHEKHAELGADEAGVSVEHHGRGLEEVVELFQQTHCSGDSKES